MALCHDAGKEGLKMNLNIRYENGSMVIHLEDFLNCHNISKVKKLVKIIRSSFTPECEGIIREYVEQEIEQIEPRQKELAKYIVGYTGKVKFCHTQLDNCTINRDKYKRNSDGWKHYNNHAKHFRQELKEIKSSLRSSQSNYDKNIRNKDFYRKVLEIVT